jgi:hypothetical protein
LKKANQKMKRRQTENCTNTTTYCLPIYFNGQSKVLD